MGDAVPDREPVASPPAPPSRSFRPSEPLSSHWSHIPNRVAYIIR